MVIAAGWRCAHDNLHAAVRSVVCAFALLAVIVAHIVRIAFVELRVGKNTKVRAQSTQSGASIFPISRHLVGGHGFGKLATPEEHGVFQGQANALEEEAILQASSMLQVVLRLQRLLHGAHAQREGLRRQLGVRKKKK